MQSQRELEPLPFPEELAYLHLWAGEIFGRSGAHMGGLAPLSHQEIAAWAAMTDRRIEPHEVEALRILDAAMQHSMTADDEPDDTPPVMRPWPERKRPPEFVKEDT